MADATVQGADGHLPLRVVQRLQQLVAQPDIAAAVLKVASEDPNLSSKLLVPILADEHASQVGRFLDGDDAESLQDVESEVKQALADDTPVSRHPGAPPGLDAALEPALRADCHAASLPLAQRQPPIGAPRMTPAGAPRQTLPLNASATAHDPGAEAEGACPQAQKRNTLVLAYLPKSASEMDVCRKLDQALRATNSIRRCRIVRNDKGESACYGFFEFWDSSTVERVLSICSAGRIVMDDQAGHAWHIRASRSKRATVASPRGRHRGRRGGAKHGVVDHEGAPGGVDVTKGPTAAVSLAGAAGQSHCGGAVDTGGHTYVAASEAALLDQGTLCMLLWRFHGADQGLFANQ